MSTRTVKLGFLTYIKDEVERMLSGEIEKAIEKERAEGLISIENLTSRMNYLTYQLFKFINYPVVKVRQKYREVFPAQKFEEFKTLVNEPLVDYVVHTIDASYYGIRIEGLACTSRGVIDFEVGSYKGGIFISIEALNAADLMYTPTGITIRRHYVSTPDALKLRESPDSLVALEGTAVYDWSLLYIHRLAEDYVCQFYFADVNFSPAIMASTIISISTI
ncbi:MAG: hypothetical protein DRO12_02505 [Thermoprotei archaeon]|nr:MAG: hypothetical protein DRO12_02505 [Thermoprotei archaeon]